MNGSRPGLKVPKYKRWLRPSRATRQHQPGSGNELPSQLDGTWSAFGRHRRPTQTAAGRSVSIWRVGMAWAPFACFTSRSGLLLVQRSRLLRVG